MKPNILIISIDSLSHQRLFTELKSAQTPNIDKLAKNGTTFEQCISSADGTELSWISLLTSQYPIQKSSSNALTKFDFENKTHFHFLKNAGYHVYGIIPEGGVLFGLEDTFENNDAGYTSEFRIYDGLGDKIIEKFDNLPQEPWLFFIHLLPPPTLPIFIGMPFLKMKYNASLYIPSFNSGLCSKRPLIVVAQCIELFLCI